MQKIKYVQFAVRSYWLPDTAWIGMEIRDHVKIVIPVKNASANASQHNANYPSRYLFEGFRSAHGNLANLFPSGRFFGFAVGP